MRGATVLLAVFLLSAAIFRVAVVREYSSSSPDGQQYHRLARELIRAGRFALGPPPQPLTFSRLPGYPLFVAAVAVRASLGDQEIVRRAALANVVLDLLTALLLALLLRDLGMPRWNGAVAVALVALCPLMFLFAVYFLTESLSTFLGTLAFWCALRSARQESKSKLYAVASGCAVGVALLVRADMITLIPALLVLVWRRATNIGLIVAAAGLMIAPWAVRNLIQFGHPHIAATEWPAQDGQPLPTGPMQWMRTWAAGRPGDGDLSSRFVFRQPATAQDLRPVMYDSAAERDELVSILDDYRPRGLDAGVNERFVALAQRRTRQHPFRTFVSLPLMRAARLFDSPPRGDYPIRVRFLGLPQSRHLLFDFANWLVYLLAAPGIVILWRRHRQVALAVAAAVACRTALHMWAVPTFVCQRYLIEVMPLLLFLDVVAIDWLFAAARNEYRRRRRA
jgi:4-amino-4-deoxy-L-arabinose transferase-like glycosyltransferase